MTKCTCEGWRPRLRGEYKPDRCYGCKAIFKDYVDALWGLDSIIGICRFCGESLGESAPPGCYECNYVEERNSTSAKEYNPYKKVWNTVEDAESALLEWVKNGTLFVPTLEELARRHMSEARYLLKRARDHGRTAEGRSAFMEALYHRDKAKTMFDANRKIVCVSR